MKKFSVGLVIGAIVFAADQLSKSMILSVFSNGEVREMIPGLFNLVLTFNKGVAFGLFGGIESEALRLTTLGVSTAAAFLVLVLYLRGYKSAPLIVIIGVSMIVGGAFGNLIDRLRHGAVTDFLDFYVGSYHWPAFNVADSAICIGVFLLLLAPSEKRVVIEGAS